MRFVALDFETTGTDPMLDRIIQVGAVLFDTAEPLARFVTYVRYTSSLPVRIKRLTGITEQQLVDAPEIQHVIENLLGFIGKEPVIAHNASFEEGFLEAEAGRAGIRLPPIRFIDTVELSRLACPDLHNHRLDIMAQSLGIPLPQHHDAESDALTCGFLFSRLRDAMSKHGSQTLEMILSVADENWPLRSLIEQALQDSPRRRFVPGFSGDIPEPLRGSGELVPVDVSSIVSLLESGNQISAAFEDYEYRQEQVQLLALVADCLNDGRHLLAEAGTGIGKSLAYLLPAARFAIDNDERVIVSTQTINLQEQLISKDIPLIKECLDWDLRASLLKGRANYVCLRRFEELLEHGLLTLGVQERRMLARIVSWLSSTSTGDRAEIHVYGAQEGLWSQLCARPGSCAGARCPYRERCFVNTSRKIAAASHIIVVNHSLVFSDISSQHKVIPTYSHIIFDEAHHLEDSATDHLGVNLVLSDVLSGIEEWQSRQQILSRIGREDVLPLERPLLDEYATRVSEASRNASRHLKDLVNVLEPVVMRAVSGSWTGRISRRLTSETVHLDEWDAIRQVATNALTALGLMSNGLAAMMEVLTDHAQEEHDFAFAQHSMSVGVFIDELRHALDTVLRQDDEDTVRWIEAHPSYMPGSITLRSAPVDVSTLLKDRLFECMRHVSMTSATLSVEASFAYVKQRLGLDDYGLDRLVEEIVGSPFDYHQQALLCIPNDMPLLHKSASKDVAARLADFLGELVREIGGRTLVLFTSHRLLQEVYHVLKPVAEAHDLCLLAQGIDGSRTRLIEELRSTERTVLMGSSSFWEGVDVAGDSLACVVMVRLPFWPPTMPVIEARQQKIEKSGRSAFYHLAVPQAVIRFKQGFGRLIRTKSDRGAVIVIDQRLAPGGSGYSQKFLDSLPGPRLFTGSSRDTISEVCQWLGVPSYDSPAD